MTEEDDLYGLPLDEFTRARNELAGRLRKGGDKQAAERVKALRKPSITAWALNQVARRHPDEVERAIAAGRDLQEAQRAMMGGRAPEDMRRTATQRREAVSALVKRAEAILQEAGSSATRVHVDRMTNTLMAATTDAGAAEELRRGRFSGDLQPSGFEGVFGLGDAVAGVEAEEEGSVAEARAAREARREAEELAGRAREADRQALRLEREADEAEAFAAGARRKADRARREADELTRRADDAVRDLEA